MRAVGYIRCSTDVQQESGLGLQAQRRMIKAQAELLGADLADVLEDAGESGATERRPAYQQLLGMIDAGWIDCLIVCKLDRLMRSVRHLTALLDRLSKAKRDDGGRGVDLVSSMDSIDTSSANGLLFIHMMAAVAEWEKNVIAERTSAALKQLQANGKRLGAPPYGFSQNGSGELVEHSEERENLKIIDELRQQGSSYRQVAEIMTAQGRLTRRGNAFTREGIFYLARLHDLGGGE